MVCRIYDNAKIKEQALMDVRSVLDIAGIYGEEMLEESCIAFIVSGDGIFGKRKGKQKYEGCVKAF